MNNINFQYFFSQLPNSSSQRIQQQSQPRANHLIIVRRQNQGQSSSNQGQPNSQIVENINVQGNESAQINQQENAEQNNQLQQDHKDFSLEIENLAVSTENLDFVKCPICMHIYVNPLACGNCLNHFCMFCIREWLIRNPNQCPLCHNFREMRCFPMLKNMLDKLQFYCINKEQGCTEITYYEQVKKHEENCEYKLETCPQKECKQQMIRKLLEKHIKEECDFAEEACKWCQKEHKKKVIKDHEELCNFKNTECNLCGLTFKLVDIDSHQEQCPENLRQCKWCSQLFKQKEIQEHQDCCGERIIKCQGCGYECCLNEHFLHMKQCKEYPVFCNKCETEMRRKEFANHSAEVCIEQNQRQMKKKILEMEKENTELKNSIYEQQLNFQAQIEQIQKSCFLDRVHFSQVYKDQDIFVKREGQVALIRETKKKRRDRFVIVELPQKLSTNPFTIQFKIISLRSEWFAVGIIDESNVYSARRYHDIGHKSYLISANGIYYSSHNPYENWQNKVFVIEQDDVISVQYENNTKLKFVNHNKNQELSIALDPETINNGNFYPCACLRCPGDCIEIIEQNQDIVQEININNNLLNVDDEGMIEEREERNI